MLVLNDLENKTSYFAKKFPNIWMKAHHKIEEKYGILLLTDDDDRNKQPNLVLYPGLTEEEIKQIESALKVTFSPDHRLFLAHYNGVDILDDVFVWGRKKEYNKDEMWEQELDLVKNQLEYRSGWDLKAEDIIIAHDRLGVIYIAQANSGNIVSYDTEFPDEPKQLGSFNSFIELSYKTSEPGFLENA